MTIDVDALMQALTLEQKVSLLAGHDAWHTVELPGVAPMRCTDGPAGVRGTSWTGPASASFPCGTALAASFDAELVEQVGQALGRETRSKGAHVLLAPTVNLHRTPIGGRNFECMSEDPALTAAIAAAYVRGVQSQHVACCIKHFVANDTEFERMSISSEVDERTLRELYLLPFEAAVTPVAEGGAGVRSVMSSYNRINGTFASEHAELLRGVLRDDWGFDGVVISDWYGTHSAAASLDAGLDLEMPGPARLRGEALLAAVQNGEVAASRVDESARRLLELFSWSGVGEIDPAEGTDDSPETRAIIRRAAIAGTVLLKNDGGLLPLSPTATVALIGPNAERGQIQGGGSARVRANRPIGPLVALTARGVPVTHERGCSIAKRLPALRGEFAVEYRGADGATAGADIDRLQLLWMDAPAPNIDRKAFAATITGTFTPNEDGEWQFGLTSVGAATLRINGHTVIDMPVPLTGGAFFGMGSPEQRAGLHLEAGRPCSVEVDYPMYEYDMLRGLIVGAEPPLRDDAIDRAVAAAAAADIAVLVVGTNDDWETEGEDRVSMALPGDQDELVRRVAAANPNTVVVLNAGSPVSMPWLHDVRAVMQVWFPGEEFGEALADMLVGVAEPGGRLPVTLPARLDDTPAFEHHPGRDGLAMYAEGLYIGYRWYDAHDIEPLFAFGHGLGYSTFTISESSATGSIGATNATNTTNATNATNTGGVTVRAIVHNTGDRTGSHVVQCYVQPDGAGPDRPPRTLQGFAKVTLDPGQSHEVAIWLPERCFSVWDVAAHDWVVPPGDYSVLVGESSRSLQLAGVMNSIT